MKKTYRVLLALFIAIIAIFFVACGGPAEPVAIIVDAGKYAVTPDTTLKDYMDEMKRTGEITFSLSNGMITEINGKANGVKSYWMLYTDDAENSDSGWGTFEYENAVYSSAKLGAEDLIIKDGYTYLWVYRVF